MSDHPYRTGLSEEIQDCSQLCKVIIGKSQAIQKVFKKINDIAVTSTTVLIEGETGTGKELVAQMIHNLSRRRERAFVAIHCASLTETLMESELFGHEKGAFTGAIKSRQGRFEFAEGGTVFLDEVAEIPLNIQVKLLRVLQEKEIQRLGGNRTIPVNVRIIAATNKILRDAVSRKKFREDLFYRLNVFPVHLPPLRDRGNDVCLIAHYFLSKHTEILCKKIHGFSPGALKQLKEYCWPGNIRELENIVEISVIQAEGATITHVNIPKDETLHWDMVIDQQILGIPFKQAKEELVARLEREYIKTYLKKYRGNVAQAARHSGISLRTFYRKMQMHAISKKHRGCANFDNIANNGKTTICGQKKIKH